MPIVIPFSRYYATRTLIRFRLLDDELNIVTGGFVVTNLTTGEHGPRGYVTIEIKEAVLPLGRWKALVEVYGNVASNTRFSAVFPVNGALPRVQDPIIIQVGTAVAATDVVTDDSLILVESFAIIGRTNEHNHRIFYELWRQQQCSRKGR